MLVNVGAQIVAAPHY